MTAEGALAARVRHACEAVDRRVWAADFAGYDPYDALNSPLLQALSFGRREGRILWTQILRRLPVNLRPLLGIRTGHNLKALGLFLEGYVRLRRLGLPDADQRIDRLLRLLCDTQREVPDAGAGWGYNFDWQSRAFFIPRGTPTVVNTAFIGHAVLNAADSIGTDRALSLVKPCRDLLMRGLRRIPEGDVFCFSYTPIDEYAVHNANLLGASLLIRLARQLNDTEARGVALTALAYTLRHQLPDGAWYYAERETSRWIDGYHTGFNLEALRRFMELGEAPEAGSAYQRGLSYYTAQLFLADGTPKARHDRVWPADIHAAAEAVCCLAPAGPEYEALTDRVMTWMLDHLYDPRGLFWFTRTQGFVNRIPYMRWSQAWGFRALTAWLDARGSASLGGAG